MRVKHKLKRAKDILALNFMTANCRLKLTADTLELSVINYQYLPKTVLKTIKFCCFFFEN